MERVFVVRLGSNTEPTQGRFDGLVEDVDTGQELRFRSADELLKFLGQCFDEALRRQHSPDPSWPPWRPPCSRSPMCQTRDALHARPFLRSLNRLLLSQNSPGVRPQAERERSRRRAVLVGLHVPGSWTEGERRGG